MAPREMRWHLLRRYLGIGVLACAAFFVVGGWYFSDDLRCPASPDESNYGEAEWRWFPIGTTCRWTEAKNGFDRVEEPGWAPTILIATMLVTGSGLVLSSFHSPRLREGG